MMSTSENTTIWGSLGSAAAALMFFYAIFQQYFPYELRGHAHRYTNKLLGFFYPYIQITFHELTGDKLKRSDAYFAIQNYLSTHTVATAKRLKADVVKDSKSLVLTMDDHEQVVDELNLDVGGGAGRVWWSSSKNIPKSRGFSFYPKTEERRFYTLTFHKRYDYKSTKWSHVQFEHPANFDTLAMASDKKEAIKKDLIKFSKAKDYYRKIGKPWKRGYLLYGPPGTGKSTMIAAMANLLDYDIYDLELTTVKDNSELRKLLIETTGKSIIIIEDIDCSLNLTGQRRKKKSYSISSSDESSSSSDEDEKKDDISKKKDEEEKKSKKGSKVTLSGLLNFIDGIWSGCGGERVIIFTTNFVDKLDPALIRRGRMDKHIEMGYCCFEAFKLLAKNYLDVEEDIVLFPKIAELLDEVKITPADVAEHLMPKSEEEDEECCLRRLVDALEELKKKMQKKKKGGKGMVKCESREKCLVNLSAV
ncbi:AAA-ATPase ASD, mitochondrial [Linum grandiflorum]